MSNSGNIEEESRGSTDGCITKKVRFKDKGIDTTDMSIDLEPTLIVSWKDMLLGNSGEFGNASGDDGEESLPSIYFSCGRYGHVKGLCSFSNGDKDGSGEKQGLKVTDSVIDFSVEDSANTVLGWLLKDVLAGM
ncbi:hypothetical protein Godav_009190 [Gossypium davidsonii]|uniref:Uncharacterized protein n=1 Tax=Gossypium davidsonii TaxID=34287 RepID=A0A7J8SCC1_GOSDV|nr:hypothetical protein [Gossypium davidsonii]